MCVCMCLCVCLCACVCVCVFVCKFCLSFFFSLSPSLSFSGAVQDGAKNPVGMRILDLSLDHTTPARTMMHSDVSEWRSDYGTSGSELKLPLLADW